MEPGDSALGFEVKLFDSLDSAEADSAGSLDRPRSLFDRLDWFRLVEAHCPPPGRLLVARARSGEGAAAWLFLAEQGGKAEAWRCWYSLRFGLVGDAQAGEAVARALRKRLNRLEIAPLDDPGPLASAFRRSGWAAFVGPATTSWRIDTQGQDFEAYWASRPGKLRNTAQRKAKAAKLDIEIHRDFDAAAWAAYEEVYEASWKPEEGSPAFLRALAEQEGAAGRLRLGVARKDGRPLAAQLWTIEAGTAWIHKLAYREDSKALSPGTVLSMAMFRAALDEDRVSRIDYGTGDDGYKRDWMAERATLWRIEAFNLASPLGLIGAARAGASALVRRARSR
ncbi:MAG TPA: GNAT family N-acetyltransferase [Allosphingosinicella sp.]|nr:GNAT family N-acetyltransferase [Allosphingosinicella sp.]